jgi:hypothetical protein
LLKKLINIISPPWNGVAHIRKEVLIKEPATLQQVDRGLHVRYMRNAL